MAQDFLSPADPSAPADPGGSGPVDGNASLDWLKALGAGALAQLDPSLMELGELAATVATATTQAAVHAQLQALRTKVRAMRRELPPLAARALSRLARRAERASGSVLDKRARLSELQATWQELLACLALRRER